MLESKYLPKFSKLNRKDFVLYGDRILVEKLEYQRKTKSGIITHVETRSHKDHYSEEKAHFAIALLVGEGFYDEKGDSVPVDVKPGDILMIPPFGVRWMSEFGPFDDYAHGEIGLTTENEIHINFGQKEEFEKFFGELNG